LDKKQVNNFNTRLTGREKQILRLIKQNLTNKEIARELSLSIYHTKSLQKNLQQAWCKRSF